VPKEELTHHWFQVNGRRAMPIAGQSGGRSELQTTIIISPGQISTRCLGSSDGLAKGLASLGMEA